MDTSSQRVNRSKLPRPHNSVQGRYGRHDNAEDEVRIGTWHDLLACQQWGIVSPVTKMKLRILHNVVRQQDQTSTMQCHQDTTVYTSNAVTH